MNQPIEMNRLTNIKLYDRINLQMRISQRSNKNSFRMYVYAKGVLFLFWMI